MRSVAPEPPPQSDLLHHRKSPKTVQQHELLGLCREGLGVFHHPEVAEQSAGFSLWQSPDDPRVSAFPTVVAQTFPAKVGKAGTEMRRMRRWRDQGSPTSINPEREPQRSRRSTYADPNDSQSQQSFSNPKRDLCSVAFAALARRASPSGRVALARPAARFARASQKSALGPPVFCERAARKIFAVMKAKHTRPAR